MFSKSGTHFGLYPLPAHYFLCGSLCDVCLEFLTHLSLSFVETQLLEHRALDMGFIQMSLVLIEISEKTVYMRQC